MPETRRETYRGYMIRLYDVDGLRFALFSKVRQKTLGYTPPTKSAEEALQEAKRRIDAEVQKR